MIKHCLAALTLAAAALAAVPGWAANHPASQPIYPAARAGLARAPRHHVPWGGVLLLGAIAVMGLSLLRRRTPDPAYGTGVSPAGTLGAAAPGGLFAGPYGGPGTYGPGPYGGVPPAGGLGAGVVAREELAQHQFNRSPGETLGDPGLSNADMGGNDSGITNDPGSWDAGRGTDDGRGWN